MGIWYPMPHLLFQVKPSTDGQPWHSSGQIFTRIAINIGQSQENIFFPPVLKSLSQIKSKYCSTNWLGYALDVSCSNKSTMVLNVVCSYQSNFFRSSHNNEFLHKSWSKLSFGISINFKIQTVAITSSLYWVVFFMNQQENKLRLSAITFLETLTQLWSCVNGNCAKEIWKSRKCKRSHDICPVCSSDQRRRSSNYHLEKNLLRWLSGS